MAIETVGRCFIRRKEKTLKGTKYMETICNTDGLKSHRQIVII